MKNRWPHPARVRLRWLRAVLGPRNLRQELVDGREDVGLSHGGLADGEQHGLGRFGGGAVVGEQELGVVEAHPHHELGVGGSAGEAPPGVGEVATGSIAPAEPKGHLRTAHNCAKGVEASGCCVPDGLVDAVVDCREGQLQLVAFRGAAELGPEAHRAGHEGHTGAGVALKHQDLAELCRDFRLELGVEVVLGAEAPGVVEALAGEGEPAAANVDACEPGLGASGGAPQAVGLGEVERGGECAACAFRIAGLGAGPGERHQAVDGSGGREGRGGVGHPGSRHNRRCPAILHAPHGSNAEGRPTGLAAPFPGPPGPPFQQGPGAMMATWNRGTRLPHIHTAVPGPESCALVDRLAQRECPGVTARRARRAAVLGVAADDPIVWARARGANVEDVDGNVYVDLTAGFGVASIGHAHPAVVGAMRAQSHDLLHAMGDAFPDRKRIQLLEVLAEKTGLDRAILGSSGSDAVEAALKTGRLASGKSGVLAFDRSYHGLSYGALAATGYKRAAFAAPFMEQLGQHVRHAEFGGALSSIDWTDIGTVLVEPIQGRGGVRVPPAGWLAELVEVAHQNGAVVVFDEIYTGFGRTGAWLRAQTEAASPDLVCLGKGMAGGFPISACVGTAAVMDAWGASKGEALHTQTFLGNPVGSAMALACISVLETVIPTVAERGEQLSTRLRGRGFDVQGAGLLLGVGLRGASTLAVSRELLQTGYIVLPAGEEAEVLALTPPLTITDDQLAGFVDALEAACRA